MLELDGLSFWYQLDRLPIIFDLKLSIESRSIVAIVGRSGSGKTTLLRLMSGLLAAERKRNAAGWSTRTCGRIWMDQSEVTEPRMDCAYVPQNYGSALLPGRSAVENVLMGERRSDAAFARAISLLREVGIADQFVGRPVSLLSGGQRQRIVLCRALYRTPSVLFLDEPFSSLDSTLTPEMGEMLLRLRDRHGIGSVLVTHDLASAVKIADSVLGLRRTHSVPEYHLFGGRIAKLEDVERWIAMRG